MGVGISDVSPAMAKKLGAPDAKGSIVSNVEPDGPADKAGFQEYDIIRAIEGKDVRDTRDLRLQVANTPPGEEIEVAVLRDGKVENLTITLGEFPTEGVVAQKSKSAEGALSGVSVEELTPAIRQRLRLGANVDGVVVTEVANGSAAAEAGLRPGDVIEEVEKKPVSNMADFREAVDAAGDEALLLLVRSQGGSRFVIIEP